MTSQAEHFEHLYQTSDDPWGYATSRYEAEKYAATLAALTCERYAFALELGCSIGVLSALLAPRCDRLLSLDIVERAVEQAAERLSPWPSARAKRAHLPSDWPEGSFDLILLSELLYYLAESEIDTLARCVARGAIPGAECVLVHYQGETGTDIRPNAACDLFCAELSALRTVEHVDHPSPADYTHRTLLLRD